MKNNVGRPKSEQKYHVMLCMTKKEHDMLVTYAELEKRPKSNAALILLRDSLLNIFSGYSDVEVVNN